MPPNNVNDLATRFNVPLEAAQGIYHQGQLAGEEKARSITTRPLAKDIPLSLNLYREAFNRGMNLSAYLESIDPSSDYNDGRDAFQRQLEVADIRVMPDMARGISAHPVERFWKSDKPGSEVLFPEFLSRVYRSVSQLSFAQQHQRFYQSSVPISDVLYPAAINEMVRQRQITAAIPLGAIIATTTPIDRDTYTAFYLTENQAERTMRRVAEGAAVPTATLTGGDHTIRLRKYGRRLQATYEAIRRSPIDRLAMHLALLAVQAESDKVASAIDVAVNGDGNAGTAATNSNLTALDPLAVAGTLSLQGYLAWRMLWNNPYACNVILGRSGDVLQALMLNVGSANVPFFQLVGNYQIGGFSPINPGLGQTAIGWTADVPDRFFLGLDSRFGLEMVLESGATLTETDRIIGTQFNEIVMTEVVGFCVFDPVANRTMNVNA